MTSQIISQEGFEKLQQEIDFLSKAKRAEIADRIQKAKDMGDLSENAEYSEAKDAQAFNEGRILEIQSILKNVNVVANSDKSHVGMGSKIVVKADDGKTKNFEIVSFNEVDPVSGKISNESPLGQAFLHKGKGDKVNITTPKGKMTYEIIEIV